MAHEELKKQYEEKVKRMEKVKCQWQLNSKKALASKKCRLSEAFDFKIKGLEAAIDILKEPEQAEMQQETIPFQPEYFSGLNWQDAKKFVGKKTEVSNDGDKWAGPFMLKGVSIYPVISRFELQSGRWTYIRTCPETYAHPTITISGVELPSPEIESPRCGCMVWVFTPFHPDGYYETTYQGYCGEEIALKRGFVHLTEDRAQAWADWWENTVIKAMKGE